MRRIAAAIVLLSTGLAVPHAQEALSREQRIADLTQLAGFYAKNYGPYEWKRDALGFDLMRLTPWLQRVHHSDDLDFQEALIEYVASLNDAHDFIAFPTTFSVSVPLAVDIYDGKVLIEALNSTVFPGVQRGDELVAVDGQLVQELIAAYRKYAISANQRSTDRIAATRLVSRSQQIMPHIVNLGDTVTLVVRLHATGELKTFTVPWTKNGIPITSQGPLPSPVRGNGRMFLSTDGQGFTTGFAAPAAGEPGSVFRIGEGTLSDNTLPDYMDPIRPLLNASVSQDYYAVLGFGSRIPVFTLPAGFNDLNAPCATCIVRPGEPIFFNIGTYLSNGVRIGYLRIPTMSPPSSAIALAQLDRAMAVLGASTDALIVDVMRNPGGLVSFVEAVAQRLIPTEFNLIGFEIRATGSWLFSFASQLNAARNNPATPPAVLANLEANFNAVLEAYNENRGRTAPVSLNSTGSLRLSPVAGAYAKPLLVLTDEFSASGGDALPAILQSNKRGPILGWRTMGAGGSVVGFSGPPYTESFFRITVSLMNRGHIVNTPDHPPAPYIENIGVRPDIPVDYMTRNNLMNGGAAFVQAFTQAVVKLVQP